MTSTIDRLDVGEPIVEPSISPQPAPAAAEVRQTASASERTPAHLLLAALLAGAGVIHLVMAPPHLGESTADGAAFLATGLVQLLFAVVVVAWPRRINVVVSVLASALLVGAWVMAHSVGLPYGSHKGAAETATFVSQVCVLLEIAAVVLGVVLAFQPRWGTKHRGAGMAFAGLAAVVALVATTAAIASPSARGHGGGGTEEAAAAGHTHGAAAAGSDSAKEVSDRGFSLLGNGHADPNAAHHAGGDVELDAATELLLRQQLAHAYELQAQYPTVADAEVAGFRRQGPFAPGLGAHYSTGLGSAGVGSPSGAPQVGPPMLIYDGIEPDAPIAGFMYSSATAGAPTEGFAGPNDGWHLHSDLCLKFGGPDGLTVLNADEPITEARCQAQGGILIQQTSYMVHLWTVPGFESSEGLFSDVNPAIRCPDGTYYSVATEERRDNSTTCNTTT